MKQQVIIMRLSIKKGLSDNPYDTLYVQDFLEAEVLKLKKYSSAAMCLREPI